jgi:hypothetical protein
LLGGKGLHESEQTANQEVSLKKSLTKKIKFTYIGHQTLHMLFPIAERSTEVKIG